MKQPKDPAKEQQDIEDEEKMKEVKGAMQSKITIDDDDDEEISLEYIDEIMKKATVDCDRDSLVPEIEEVIDDVDAVYKSAIEFPKRL
ncbi:unnamed protein product [Durusdinium trenchii]|uniref:Uncharacterized protein n=1 Tax=Durusdinium trenchii TaxID=1381693 RepID=A0ABP0N824_9DINO